VESQPGKGSTFWFTAVFEKQCGTSAPAAAALDWPGPVKVLVADVTQAPGGWPARSSRPAAASRWKLRTCPPALILLEAAVASGDPFRVALLDAELSGGEGQPLEGWFAEDPRRRQTRSCG